MYHPGPLEGIRIIDFTHVLAGPFTTMLLGDLGAEIIKIEIPGRGDSTRQSGPPFKNGESAYFIAHNRNKKSISVDLKKPEGADLAKRLVTGADVVVESFRRGVMERLGLGYDALKELKPDLIYASLNAFGGKGPYRDKPGFELIVQGLTGLVDVTTEPGRTPAKIQIQVVDLCAGLYLTTAIVSAIYHRQKTGEGQRVETSLLESTAAMMHNLASIYFMEGRVPTGMFTKNPQVMPSQALKTSDGHVLVVTQPQHWKRFCLALERPEWIDDENLRDGGYRVDHYDEVEALIESVTKTGTTREWLRRFEENDIAAGPINTVEEMFQDPQFKALDMTVPMKHKIAGDIRVINQPWHFSKTPGGVKSAPPLLGEHSIEVLAGQGYTRDEIADLKRKGVIFDSGSSSE
ncbi:MAG: CoA transferase [Deltaproteobacteria bacterium]|nr:CoA transferase [Deltaproteobacteria bacterium]